jgi:uncharacterized integral membrane protein
MSDGEVDRPGEIDTGAETDSHDSLPAEVEPTDEAGSESLERPGPTRAQFAWVGAAVGLLALVLVLLFIVVNLERVRIDLLFATVRLPVGVAILLGFVLGGLAVFAIGVVRVAQLKRRAKIASSNKIR